MRHCSRNLRRCWALDVASLNWAPNTSRMAHIRRPQVSDPSGVRRPFSPRCMPLGLVAALVAFSPSVRAGGADGPVAVQEELPDAQMAWSVRAGYGAWSPGWLAYQWARAASPIPGTSSSGVALGPFALVVEKEVGRRFTWGVTFGLVQERVTWHDAGTPPGAAPRRTRVDLQSFTGHVRVRYASRGYFELYSGLSLGAAWGTTWGLDAPTGRQTHLSPAFHVHALGFRWGGRIGVWAEAGAGLSALGILNGGLVARF
jgi:hypothetical protein